MSEINNSTVAYGYQNVDFTKVSAMLSQAYWSEGIGIDEVKKGAANSALVVSVYHDGEQIGYARVISDRTRFAYILDVYVDDKHRRKGIGQLMINSILDHEDLRDVYQWLIVSRDAHGVYGKSGFEPLNNPEKWMQLFHERPKR